MKFIIIQCHSTPRTLCVLLCLTLFNALEKVNEQVEIDGICIFFQK